MPPASGSPPPNASTPSIFRIGSELRILISIVSYEFPTLSVAVTYIENSSLDEVSGATTVTL